MAADGTTESLFLSLTKYDHFDHSKRIRRDNHLASYNAANSFSYSSGFELNSPSYGSTTFQESDDTGFVDQTITEVENSSPNYSRSQAFEAFYDSLKTTSFGNYIGFSSSLSGNARSIQNGEFLDRNFLFWTGLASTTCILKFRDQNMSRLFG